MSNYSSLKATINANIKTNGNQEITGAVLNSVLNAMVTSVGAGFLFAGVAKPTDNPGTPDQNVCYLAGVAGTYTHFGNLVLAEGEVAFLKYNGSWVKQTADISSKSFGEYAYTIAKSVSSIPSYTETSGQYIHVNGSVQTSSGFAFTSLIDLAPGKTIVVFARGYSTNIAMIAKYISTNRYSSLANSIDSQRRIYHYTNNSGETIQVACSYNYNVEHTIYISDIVNQELFLSLESRVSQNESDLSLLRPMAGVTYTPLVVENKDHYITPGGGIASSSDTAYTDPIFVPMGGVVNLRARGYLTYLSMISIYNPDTGTYVNVVSSVDSSVRDYTYTATENCFIVCSYYTNHEHSLSITTQSVYDSIEHVNQRVDQLDNPFDVPEVLDIPVAETGKFIDGGGSVASSSGFNYTEPFTLTKGEGLRIMARGYLTNVSILAKVPAAGGSRYTPVIISEGSVYKEYLYLCTEDSATFVISYNAAWGFVATKFEDQRLTAVIDDGEAKLPEGTFYRSMLFAGVPKFGIIGDSLATGVSSDGNTISEHPEYAWWRVWERDSGRSYLRLCQGGMSARSFINNNSYGLPVALTAGNECQVYIIALEVNDRSGIYPSDPTYLGSPADIDLNNPDNNADTYYGDYAKIIQKITAFNPGAKFILMTNPRTDGDFNNAIRYIANLFSNCFLCDLWANYSTLYVSGGYFHRMQDSSAHYPALAYQAMGKLLEIAVSEVINDNISEFKFIQFA